MARPDRLSLVSHHQGRKTKNWLSCAFAAMQIFVKSSAGSVAVQCLPTDKIEDVKCMISERTGLKEPELAYNGRVMEDVCTLDDYLVSEEATLEAYVPVLGGTLAIKYI
jgi:hypothetical protein